MRISDWSTDVGSSDLHHYDIDLAVIGVDGWLKLEGKRHEGHYRGCKSAAATQQQCFPAIMKGPAQYADIAIHQPTLTMAGVTLGLQEIGRHHGRNHARDGKAHQDSSHHCHAELNEELP